MPYNYPNNIPAWSKNLPKGAQKIAVSVFNAALTDGKSEDDARIAAWGAIKQKYKKVDDKWVKKSFSVKLDDYATDGNLPDDVAELPGSMPEVWKELYNRLVGKDISVPIARNHSWKVVKRYVYRAKNGKWHMKKLALPEKILGTVNVIKKRSAEMKVFTPGNENGLFQLIIPLDEKSLEVKDGKKFLKGVASANWIDREDDVMMPSFIKKMKDMAKSLPVFVDHQRDSDHLIGHVASVPETSDEIFISETELEKEWTEENPTGNKQVTTLLKRLPDIKFGYSIGGRFTKAVKRWRSDLSKYVREIYDGELYELSVVPVPALKGTDVQLITKNFGGDFFVDADEDQLYKEFPSDLVKDSKSIPYIADGISSDTELSESDLFWMDFSKAVDKYVSLSERQPKWSDIDKTSLPDSCFTHVSLDRSIRKYPYKYITKSGKQEIHLEGLDESYKKAKEDGDKISFKSLESVRDNLGLGEREYKYVDFRKLLVGTLTDAIDAKDARYRLYDVVDQYIYTVDDIIWGEMSFDEKAQDLTDLTAQLVSELSDLTDKMSKEVIIAVKNLSIE